MSDAKPFQIWDNEAIRAIKATAPIAKEGEFTADDMVEIDRLLTACCMVIQDEENREHPKTIKAQLTGLRNGFGCWLEFVERGILQAKLDDADRHLMHGAFCMAYAFLFDIEGHNRTGAAEAQALIRRLHPDELLRFDTRPGDDCYLARIETVPGDGPDKVLEQLSFQDDVWIKAVSPMIDSANIIDSLTGKQVFRNSADFPL
jgi:hypothetical protein